jgi:hypothetical protein
MRFRLFPLYMDARQEDYRTTNLLWPLVSWGGNEKRSHLRVIPFYGESDSEGKSWSRSVLWPLVSWGEERLHTEHPAKNVLVFPFYGESASDQSWTRTYLFPFFSFAGNEAGYRDTNLFWPFYRRMDAPDGRWALRVWPFYGTVRGENRREDFYLWPIFWQKKIVMPEGALASFQAVPVYRRTVTYSDPEDEESETGRETQVWPLVKHTEERGGAARTVVLAPIPFTSFPDFEANYGWLWTLFEHYEEEKREKVSVLSGLMGYERDEEETLIRLFWLIEVPL